MLRGSVRCQLLVGSRHMRVTRGSFDERIVPQTAGPSQPVSCGYAVKRESFGRLVSAL